MQVKFSKDFNTTHTKELFRKDIRSTGWWTLKKEKIQKSKADYWVFILYSFDSKISDYVIIKPNELLDIFKKTNRNTDTIHCYITITKNKQAFETRGISKDKRSDAEMELTGTIRDLTQYIDNWDVLEALNK